MDLHSEVQPVSYKRYFRCNNCFLLLLYTINLSLKYRFGRPATDAYLLYETCVIYFYKKKLRLKLRKDYEGRGYS